MIFLVLTTLTNRELDLNNEQRVDFNEWLQCQGTPTGGGETPTCPQLHCHSKKLVLVLIKHLRHG
jgi:hypothetical protein